NTPSAPVSATSAASALSAPTSAACKMMMGCISLPRDAGFAAGAAHIGPAPVEIGGADHVEIAPAIDQPVPRPDVVTEAQHHAVGDFHRAPIGAGALPSGEAAHPRPQARHRHEKGHMPAP